MRRLLVINPNTSESVTALLQSHCQRVAGPDVQVHTFTARFGAPYIACEGSYAVAGHAVLDAWATAVADRGPAFDAILIGCFGDPGLMALREISAVPVTGLAEAAFTEAARFGRFAIVTGGVRWQPMLERLAHSLGFGGRLAGIQTVPQSGAELARDRVAAGRILSRACREAVRQFDAKSVIVGGAGLAGMAETMQPEFSLPLIDSVVAGVQLALSGHSPIVADDRRFDFSWHKVSPELAARGEPPPRLG